MAFPDRLILHPPPGAGSLLLGEHPLGAGRVNALLAHNGRFLSLANSRRPLASHGGWRDFYGASTRGTGWTGTPEAGDLHWERVSGQFANACLGTHYVHTDGYLAALPTLVLRFRVAVTSPHTCGVCLVVVPGTGGPLTAARSSGETFTGASFQNGRVLLALRPDDLRPVDRTILPGDGTGTVDEASAPQVFTVYVAAYCSSGKNGQGASVIGLSLSLEPSS